MKSILWKISRDFFEKKNSAKFSRIESILAGTQMTLPWVQQNIIKFKLPAGMKAIDGTSHQPAFKVGKLPMPKGGFFPTYFPTELQVEEEK
jgi:hypothetical protein